MTPRFVYAPAVLLALILAGPSPASAASVDRLPLTVRAVQGAEPRFMKLDQALAPATHQLRPADIQQSIMRFLEREMAGQVRAVHATMVDPQESIQVPSGSTGLTITSHGFDEGLGRRTFHVQINANGRLWQTIDATADIGASVDAVVPIRVIKVDDLIEAEDLTIQRIKLRELNHQLATSLNDVVGKSAARPLQPNMPIRLAMIKKPYAVHKGDRVAIEARHGGLSIQATGVTKASGELGQSITVANVDSGKELRAKIVAPGVVRVEY
jgi:flagellar basal body P-ring formation protein FlgA